ncbi:MAG TPA: FKBP-type peptidyl-prolyl cis-trans isomerase [Flavisolibacter sp.]|jgi:FKBP-type peptidyl-prolyl cis-trans isomerase FkpA
MLKNTLIASLMVILLSSCLKDNGDECNYDDCSFKAPDSEVATLQAHITANNITAIKHCSGFFYRIENEGSGDRPVACSNVAARYKGTYLNGAPLDQSTSPVVFSLGNVIRGWTNGVPMIKEGGRIVLYIPPALAYGPNDYIDPRTGNVVVAGNSYLVFEIDLVEVQ